MAFIAFMGAMKATKKTSSVNTKSGLIGHKRTLARPLASIPRWNGGPIVCIAQVARAVRVVSASGVGRARHRSCGGRRGRGRRCRAAIAARSFVPDTMLCARSDALRMARVERPVMREEAETMLTDVVVVGPLRCGCHLGRKRGCKSCGGRPRDLCAAVAVLVA